jgi:single-strand DNA-binding protein
VNKVFLIGNLGRDPEIGRFNSGDRWAKFSLATSESWKDKRSGERKEKTEWHQVVCFGDGLIGVIEKYAKKGTKLIVQGKLQTRKWQDQQGNDRYSTEVVVRGYDCSIELLPASKGSGGPPMDESAYDGPMRGDERDRGYDENEGNVPDEERSFL